MHVNHAFLRSLLVVCIVALLTVISITTLLYLFGCLLKCIFLVKEFLLNLVVTSLNTMLCLARSQLDWKDFSRGTILVLVLVLFSNYCSSSGLTQNLKV